METTERSSENSRGARTRSARANHAADQKAAIGFGTASISKQTKTYSQAGGTQNHKATCTEGLCVGKEDLSRDTFIPTKTAKALTALADAG